MKEVFLCPVFISMEEVTFKDILTHQKGRNLLNFQMRVTGVAGLSYRRGKRGLTYPFMYKTLSFTFAIANSKYDDVIKGTSCVPE